MRKLNKDFYNIATNNDWVDLSDFWSWPLTQILDDVKAIPDNLWAKPFDGGDKEKGKGYNNTQSNINLPGTEKGSEKIPAKGWKSVMFLNDTGISDNQILTFDAMYQNQWEYKKRLKYVNKVRTWTDIAKFSPTLKTFFFDKIFPYIGVAYIFVTQLEPGGIISQHNDIPDGAKPLNTGEKLFAYDMCNVFNLCLNDVDYCHAVFNKKIMPSHDGCLMWTNTGKDHWVVNMNREPQYKIIFQGFFKKPFREKVVNEKSEYLNAQDIH